MRLRQIGGSGCGNGPCPAVFETENNTIIVQGFQVEPDVVGLHLPPGEDAVEIPRYILEQAFGMHKADAVRQIGEVSLFSIVINSGAVSRSSGSLPPVSRPCLSTPSMTSEKISRSTWPAPRFRRTGTGTGPRTYAPLPSRKSTWVGYTSSIMS
jgi:hypothetical protein